MKKGEIRMPYDVKRFIFSVSLCAMLAANPVLATAPTNDEDLGTTHDVYVESTLNQATNGIAGVSYVNRMVNAAGNAADAAEAHAAAAGAHALSAAQSADEAHKVLADKVSIDQGEVNKNKVMVTNASGYVAPGYITNDMINSDEVSAGQPLVSRTGGAYWGAISEGGISDNAVTASKIRDRSVSFKKLSYDNAYASGRLSDGIPLTTDGETGLSLSQISSVGIANGAVTIEKTAGVVGMVPVGAEGATTYGSFWIE